MSCANFCSSHFIRFWTRTKRDFHRIWIAMETICEMGSMPNIHVHMFTRGLVVCSPQTCSHLKDTRLLCPTPWISLPEEYADLDVIQDASDVTTYSVNKRSLSGSSLIDTISGHHNPRRKRAFTDYDGVISNANLKFSPSLHLDGLMTYRDLKVPLPLYADMTLYGNPILFSFTETPRKFDPKKEEWLKISVSSLKKIGQCCWNKAVVDTMYHLQNL